MSGTSSPSYQLINNFRHDPSFQLESIEFALNYKPEISDKFVVTYPKCGTTWTQLGLNVLFLVINFFGVRHGLRRINRKMPIFELFKTFKTVFLR
jgi:hypothetical protein